MSGFNTKKMEIEQEIEKKIRVMDDDSLLDEFEQVARKPFYDRTNTEDIAYDVIRATLLSRMAKPYAG